jgi:ABC-2 type transport system ATP-binding protein
VLAIETRGITKTYGRSFGSPAVEALRGVDLRVERGTAFGLIGPNGAGKTTFVKTLLGIVRPTAGSVRILGGDPDDPQVRARVGYLPERLQLPAAWTPREVLASVARLKRVRRPAGEIERLLAEVGLEDAASRRAGSFSKGMRQRLGLACALVGAPDLLVLDEPTDGLDPLARVAVRDLLAREVARGVTVFVNSHLLAETERVCGRVGILVQGRVAREVASGPERGAVGRWSVRFEGALAPEIATDAGLVAGGEAGAWTFEGDASSLNAALDVARARGALLIEVTRRAEDLERVLAETAGGRS